MASPPIRAVLVLKKRPARASSKTPLKSAEARHGDLMDEPELDTEMMCALRAMPRRASLERAQRALGRHYKFELVSYESDNLENPTPEMRVLYFELTAKSHGMDFKSACSKALSAMRLAPKGMKGCIPFVYPPCPSISFSRMESMPLCEQLDWFKTRMGNTLRATASELERQSILRDCPEIEAPGREVKASWL